MSGSREEERRKLADIINHWNANRLDLFEISQPTEVREAADSAGGTGRAPGSQLGPVVSWEKPGIFDVLESLMFNLKVFQTKMFSELDLLG